MFQTTISPRVNETNYTGHICNTSIPIWLEKAREPIVRMVHPETAPGGKSFILARTEIDFQSQMFFGEDVEVKTYVVNLGRTSMTVEQEIWQQGKITATCKAVMVYFDYDNQTSIELTPQIKSAFEIHGRALG
ncbi:acyl-CoA thioesterase [Sessilibacter corallicola]|uniref:Thioesterase n=1 Tax=Sessilibacter corallicola TaxID=2904075 RepID=A0ABQ0A9E1_9GAMM|nr:thioesterase family protein [Sessilibacter corallicola]MCE2030299.1 acyl-CoA thioesterase [Sessilibacter corallicola]